MDGFGAEGSPGGQGAAPRSSDSYWARPAPATTPSPAPAAPVAAPVAGPLSATATPPAPAQGTPKPFRRSKALVAVLALVLVAGGVVGGVVASSNGRSVPGAGMAPAAFVVSSTQTTMSRHTADVTLSGTMNGPNGAVVPIRGTGQADFDSNAFSADMTMTSASTALDERELVTAGHVYIDLTVDGTNMSAVTGGRQWIDVPLPDQGSGALGAGNVDPLDQLKLLEQQGAAVVPLGTSSVGGVTVSGYAVTPSQAEIQQNLQDEIQSLHLTPAQAQQLLDSARRLGTPTVRVFFDGGGLLRRLAVSVGGGTSSVNGTVQMDFSDFGAPVDIQAPPSSDVIGFDQFMQDAQAFDATHQA